MKTAEEWLKDEYFDEETGDWLPYDVYEAIENYVIYASQREPAKDESIQAWICPRCAKVHSYLSLTCDCPPNTIAASTYTEIPKTFTGKYLFISEQPEISDEENMKISIMQE